jgi:hypothetical protein
MTSPASGPKKPRPKGWWWAPLYVISVGLLSIAMLFAPVRVQSAILSGLGAAVLGGGGLAAFGVAYVNIRRKRPFFAAALVVLGGSLLVIACDSGLRLWRLVRGE